MAFLIRSRSGALCLAVALLQAPLGARQQPTLENDVKAAFLFNFTKFVDWPPSAMQGSDTFRVCVFADRAFTASLDRIIEGESANGLPLRRVTPSPLELPRCHILYVNGSEAAQARGLLAAVRGAAVLSVGDGPEFLEQGGIIAFELEGNRVRFDVELRNAAGARLAISSKLLRVARRVVGDTTR
jgi:uncharacterized protein DUF4154